MCWHKDINMNNLLIVFLGGGFGALLRYGTYSFCNKNYSGVFPYGTLAVNIIGAFVIGILSAIWLSSFNHKWQLFLFVGFLGGFTTFSAFSIETLNFLKIGQFKWALLNIFAHNFFSLLFVAGGFFLAKNIINKF